MPHEPDDRPDEKPSEAPPDTAITGEPQSPAVPSDQPQPPEGGPATAVQTSEEPRRRRRRRRRKPRPPGIPGSVEGAPAGGEAQDPAQIAAGPAPGAVMRDETAPDRGPRSRGPGRPAPRDRRPRAEKPPGSGPEAQGARAPGAREDRPRGDRPPGDRPREDRSRGDRPPGDRPPGDRPRGDRPRGDRPRGPKGRPGGNDRNAPRKRPEPKLYSFESVVDRGFEDVADEANEGATRRVGWTILKRSVADQTSARPVSAVYILKRDGVDTEFANLSAARLAVNKTIVHPEKLTRAKADYAISKK